MNIQSKSVINALEKAINKDINDITLEDTKKIFRLNIISTKDTYELSKVTEDLKFLEGIERNIELEFKEFDIGDFKFDKIPNINKLSFTACVINNPDLTKLDKLSELNLDSCNFNTLQFINTNENINKLNISMNTKTIVDEEILKKVKKDNKNFDELNTMSKINLVKAAGGILITKEKNDLNGIDKLENIASLKIENCDFTNNALNNISNNKSVTNLTISSCDNVDIEKIITNKLETYSDDTFRDQLNGYVNLDKIVNGKNLKTVRMSNNKEIKNYIGKIKNLETAYLKNCDITSLKCVSDLKKLQYLNLDNNPVEDITNLNNMNNLKHLSINDSNIDISCFPILTNEDNNLDSISYRRTKLENELNDIKLDITEDECNSLKKILYLSNDKYNITLNDVLSKNAKLELPSIALTGNNDISTFKNYGITFNKVFINTSGKLGKEQIENLKLNINDIGVEKLSLVSMKSHTDLPTEFLNNLNSLDKLNFEVDDVLGQYNKQEIIAISNEINDIVAKIPENANDIEKTKLIYDILGERISYDYSGCLYDDNYVEGRDIITRNLVGTLLENKGVCVGIARTVDALLKEVDVKSQVVSGNVPNIEDSGHAWNQVIIDNKSYNLDLTWDEQAIKNNKPLEWFLLSDDEFNKTHKCNEDCEKIIYICKETMENENYNKIDLENVTRKYKEQNREKENLATVITNLNNKQIKNELSNEIVEKDEVR